VDQFEQENQKYLLQGLRLAAADVSDGRFAGVWRPGSGAQRWYSGAVATAAKMDQQYVKEGLRLTSLSLHEGGVLCVWRPGAGTQWWAPGLTLEEFNAKNTKYFNEGLRLTAVDELNGRFAGLWRPGTGAQWSAWGSVADIAAKDKAYFAQDLRISAIGGHKGRLMAVWRPGAGAQWWAPGLALEKFKAKDTDYFAQNLRLSALRVLADPSAWNPQMNGWSLVADQEFDNLQFTEECQGLTTDGSSWLLTSNNEDFRGVHRRSLDFKSHLANAALPAGAGSHPGDPDFDPATGRLYIPVETKPNVWVLNKQLQTIMVAHLGGKVAPPQGGSMPWCAINPWNGWLYSSIYGEPGESKVDRVYAYDPANQFTHVATLVLGGPPLQEVQGGCFSARGHLYLTSGVSGRIHAYDSMDGTPLGSAVVPYKPGGVDQEEMEGIALGHLIHGNGSHSWVHVVILDNDLNGDDVFLKHFSVPKPANL